ncbi:hypothetical protein A4X09_0g7846 [Tilletia walkeri]|uniref:Uncharacterized protein n=1 Tax=Tilletia walkeri TaxID=117179 RepID=A0A8X7T0Z0_9BASI|nr:hypothetical protein A4X09_0g7846 [Tilletia walkeri]
MVTRLDPRGRWLSRERGGQDFLAKTALNPHKQITGPYVPTDRSTLNFEDPFSSIPTDLRINGSQFWTPMTPFCIRDVQIER